ncbi:MAG: fucose isomerase [Muribaculaceae bacterium]|nr:fucose isomerase [Muribaculaceae bacterium]
MTLNLIAFTSVLHDAKMVRQSHEAVITELEKAFDQVNILTPAEAPQLPVEAFRVLFIATGGVECQVKNDFDYLPDPTLLVADGTHNSLAASLEISSFLRDHGKHSEVVHGTPVHIAHRLLELSHLHEVRAKLAGKRIGVIGEPSDWLIASGVDAGTLRSRWGIELVQVPLNEVYEAYDSVTDAEVAEACTRLTERAKGCVEPTADDITRAMRLAEAIRRVVDADKLDAVTLACFRLLERTGTSGCMALSLLNDMGIMAACEGDLQTLFTMMVVQAATGKPSFMANPSKIDTYSNEVVLAHCTIGLDQTREFVLRNHFESQSGVAVRGILPEGKVTVVKCGGPNLDRFFVTSAYLQENLNHENLCRTQVRLHFNQPASYFLRQSIGNHHVLLRGDYADMLADLLTAAGLHRVH